MSEITEDSAVELVPEKEEAYPWAADDDERRRCFVFEYMSSPDIDGKVLIGNMDGMLVWLKTGKIPSGNTRPTLKVASGS